VSRRARCGERPAGSRASGCASRPGARMGDRVTELVLLECGSVPTGAGIVDTATQRLAGARRRVQSWLHLRGPRLRWPMVWAGKRRPTPLLPRRGTREGSKPGQSLTIALDLAKGRRAGRRRGSVRMHWDRVSVSSWRCNCERPHRRDPRGIALLELTKRRPSSRWLGRTRCR
jgi:hypothetical protein